MATRATSTRKRKKSRSGLIIGIVLGVLFIIALMMFFGGGGEGEGILVETEQAERRTIVETVTASGMIEPETQVVISSEVSGEIIYLGVEEGESVEKGQVLVRINPETIVAQREQTEAQILSARTRVASAKAGMLKAESEYNRLKRLYEKQLVTTQELETAESQVKITEAEHEAAQYQVQQAEASLRQVNESVNKTTIRSPISGIVTKLNMKVGEKVVGAIQMTGTEIMTVADLSVIEAVVDVVETDVVGVDLGDEAEIEVDAFGNRKFRGVVSQIANSAKSTGMGTQDQLTNFAVRLRFTDPDGRFRPGMRATAFITTEKRDNVVAVPIQSVTTRQPDENEAQTDDPDDNVRDLRLEDGAEERKPETVVFVVEGDSVRTKTVKTGIQDDRYIEITDGLSEGTTVVSGSYQAISKQLQDGSAIRRKGETETETKSDAK